MAMTRGFARLFEYISGVLLELTAFVQPFMRAASDEPAPRMAAAITHRYVTDVSC